MPVRNVSEQSLPVVISVSDMARRIGLSRSRFYELVRGGFLPAPVYALSSRRPMYLTEQIIECMKVKQSNVGVNGQYMLFYAARQENRNGGMNRSSRAAESAGSVHPNVASGLRALGMTASQRQVDSAVQACFPTGLQGHDDGHVLRAVWQHLRRSNAA